MTAQLKKIIVTGGAGFIGSHLVKKLESSGHKVEIIDIATDKERDVRHLDKIKKLFLGADTVFHLAALVSVPYSIDYPIETNLTNLNGTLHVLSAARDAQVRRVVFSSSAAIYGDQKELPVREDAEAMPMSPYALQKLGSEEYLRLFSKVYKLETVSLRYFNIYGPGQNSSGPYASVIPKFIEQRKSGGVLTIVGDGSQTRDFVHVGDVVRANLSAMESDKVGAGEAINIASGKSVSIRQIAELIGGPIEYLPPRVEIQDSLGSISLAKRLLDWEPEIRLDTGLGELLK